MKSSTLTKITTCQICARPIKANTGTIAHHGYSRPGFGYQTRSCYGAHFQPYEQSRDAISGALEGLHNHIEWQNQIINELMTNSPATLTTVPKYNYQDPETFEKPADFDAAATVAERYFYNEGYKEEFSRRIRSAQKEIKEAQLEMVFLQKRYDEWKPAA